MNPIIESGVECRQHMPELSLLTQQCAYRSFSPPHTKVYSSIGNSILGDTKCWGDSFPRDRFLPRYARRSVVMSSSCTALSKKTSIQPYKLLCCIGGTNSPKETDAKSRWPPHRTSSIDHKSERLICWAFSRRSQHCTVQRAKTRTITEF